MRRVPASAVLIAAFAPSCAPENAGPCDGSTKTPAVPCPGLFTLQVAPPTVEVGGGAALTAMAPPGTAAPTALSWSAPSGTFSDPSSPHTMFTCVVAGDVTVTLTVTQPRCIETFRAQVQCVGPTDGGMED